MNSESVSSIRNRRAASALSSCLPGFLIDHALQQTGCTSRKLSVLICAITLLASSIALPANACMSYELNSVHFNSNQPDFGRLPRRASIASRYEYNSRPGAGDGPGDYVHSELYEPREQKRSDERADEVMRGLAAAQSQVIAGRYEQAIALYRALTRRFGRSGNLQDLIETVQEARPVVVSKPVSPDLSSDLASYLQAMALYEARDYAQSNALLAKIYSDVRPGSDSEFLRSRALYQQASITFEWFDYKRAMGLYQQVVREFPSSSKREAALIMIARCAILPETDEGRSLQEGQTALATLLKEYPASRFRAPAAGLQARIDWLEERYAPALKAYLSIDDMDSVEQVCRSLTGPALQRAHVELLAGRMRRLNAVTTYRMYERTISSIDHLTRHLSPEEIKGFHDRLLNDPDTAAGYLYYRLNHTTNHAADTDRLTRLAEQVSAKYPKVKLPPLLLVEIAEVYYHRGRYDLAEKWSTACLQRDPKYDRALFVRGAARDKLKQLTGAADDLDVLLRECPESGLRAAAREEAALVAERSGNWQLALSHYFALDYPLDVAYLLDVRMSPKEAETYYQSRDAREKCFLPPTWRDEGESKSITCRRSDVVAYALGIRYLRAEKWGISERWLKRVPPDLYATFSLGRSKWSSRPSLDPISGLHALRALANAAQNARTDSARAEALFRYGSYYHSHGDLLLYNPVLWRGERATGFGMWWNDRAAASADKAAVRNYMYEHEVYARSLKTCLSVYERYPSAPVAPQALYRAACAARALASFNGWWRENNKHTDHWAQSVRLMKQVARRYPHHPLAKEARKYAAVFAQERIGLDQ